MQDHITTAILDQAARVLAERREAASLADIARAAGVARSTLYRYFPSREALLQALAGLAATELRTRVHEAEVETLPVPEAIARVTRGFIATGSKYVALAYLQPKPAGSGDPELNQPLLLLFERGIRDGSLRKDLSAQTLLSIYADLIEGAIYRAAREQSGVEHASAGILTVFLEGALCQAADP